MAVKCPKCRSENTDTARFCSNCATSLAPVKTAPPSLTETLKSPTRLVTTGAILNGRYEILGPIGAGGMGEVYRALDKNLCRHVAIKILPAAFAEDVERMARFQREAKLLAALNHPNVAAIHGLEESEGRRFLVLELAEGETLQLRLQRGALPVEEALETCRQLAEGLEAAHEKGIIHRDLKPGNIMITPEGKVKILDFGLAKAHAGETTGIDIEMSPTITAQMTEPGIILGTAAYMSPEQARGRSVDKRTDIWAFGCVLYECLTGNRAFHGETVSDTLAHILKAEPDWTLLPPDTPLPIRSLLRHCLQRDPALRLHDIADARIEIALPATYPSETLAARQRLSLLWLIAGMAVALLAGILIGPALMRFIQPAPPIYSVTSTIKVEPGYWLDGMRAPLEMERPSRTAFAISSDGRFIVYSAVKQNPSPQATPCLFLRRMGEPNARPIVGSDGGINPFLSPDNRWVGFWADKKLKKLPIEGGVSIELCDAYLLFGASWGRDNSIIFSDGDSTGLSRVSAEGGKPEVLTRPDPKRDEASHRLPSCLPNGNAVVFTVMNHYRDPRPGLALLRMDKGEWHALLSDAADAKYVPTGHLLFVRQGSICAVRFDLSKLEVIGQPFPLVENVIQAFGKDSALNSGAGQFAVSATGSLIYAAGGLVPLLDNTLVWVDQAGDEQPITAAPFPYFAPRLSPDGRRIAYALLARERQVWVYDLISGTNSRLTSEGRAVRPIWSPDGKRLLFGWEKSQRQNLFSQPYDGSSPMERVTESPASQYAASWSPDGKTVALVESRPDTGYDISLLDVNSKSVKPFLNSQFDEMYPDFSPDGRWIAYVSNETNRNEVYIRAFPGSGGKQLISIDGGTEPLWARGTKQIYYRRGDQVWAVDIQTDSGFTSRKPGLLFEKSGYLLIGPVRSYDLSLDGQRFLMTKLDQRKPTPVTELTLVQNWFEELKRLAPTGKK